MRLAVVVLLSSQAFCHSKKSPKGKSSSALRDEGFRAVGSLHLTDDPNLIGDPRYLGCPVRAMQDNYNSGGNVPDACFAITGNVFKNASEFEKLLAVDNYSRLGLDPLAISTCIIQNSQFKDMDDANRRKVIADVYYQANAVRAAALGAIEAMAAIDVLLGQEVLPEGGLASKFVVESDRWVIRLRATCRHYLGTWGAMVQRTKKYIFDNSLFWWFERYHPERSCNNAKIPRACTREELEEMRQDLLREAPWLLGEKMRGVALIQLSPLSNDPAGQIDREIKKLGAAGGDIEGALRAQLLDNRQRIYTKLQEYNHAASCIFNAGLTASTCGDLYSIVKDLGFDARPLANSAREEERMAREYVAAQAKAHKDIGPTMGKALQRQFQSFAQPQGLVNALHSAQCRTTDVLAPKEFWQRMRREMLELALTQFLPGGALRLVGLAQRLAQSGSKAATALVVAHKAFELIQMGGSTYLATSGLGGAVTECTKAASGALADPNLHLAVSDPENICHNGAPFHDNANQLIPTAIRDYGTCMTNSIVELAFGAIGAKSLLQQYKLSRLADAPLDDSEVVAENDQPTDGSGDSSASSTSEALLPGDVSSSDSTISDAPPDATDSANTDETSDLSADEVDDPDSDPNLNPDLDFSDLPDDPNVADLYDSCESLSCDETIGEACVGDDPICVLDTATAEDSLPDDEGLAASDGSEGVEVPDDGVANAGSSDASAVPGEAGGPCVSGVCNDDNLTCVEDTCVGANPT